MCAAFLKQAVAFQRQGHLAGNLLEDGLRLQGEGVPPGADGVQRPQNAVADLEGQDRPRGKILPAQTGILREHLVPLPDLLLDQGARLAGHPDRSGVLRQDLPGFHQPAPLPGRGVHAHFPGGFPQGDGQPVHRQNALQPLLDARQGIFGVFPGVEFGDNFAQNALLLGAQLRFLKQERVFQCQGQLVGDVLHQPLLVLVPVPARLVVDDLQQAQRLVRHGDGYCQRRLHPRGGWIGDGLHFLQTLFARAGVGAGDRGWQPVIADGKAHRFGEGRGCGGQRRGVLLRGGGGGLCFLLRGGFHHLAEAAPALAGVAENVGPRGDPLIVGGLVAQGDFQGFVLLLQGGAQLTG